jgi:hypothetical protein
VPALADPQTLARAVLIVQQARRASQEAQQVDYTTQPVRWVEERLREHLWSKQREIAEALVTDRRVAVPSCHAAGKSFLASRIVGWWLDVHEPGDAFVVTTAPTASQVRAILWREINRVHRKGNLPGHTNQTEWWINDEMVAFGRKPSDYDPSGFQGIHARRVLVVLDEAGGIPESIYLAGNSLAANEHSRILAIGNPDDPASHFAAVCRPGSGWTVIQVDGLQSPNFTGEDVPADLRDLLIGPTYVEEMRRDVGEESPVYTSKVRGAFPEDASDGVVLLSWVRKCQQTEDRDPSTLTPVELGVDVGAGGDETVVRERRGPVAGRTWRKRTPNWADGVAQVLEAIDATGATRVKVDMIGVGWGIVGRLKELRDEGRHKAEIVGINVGESALEPAKFPKLRDQLWWDVGRELSRTGGWDLSQVDDTTVSQLIAPTYQRDSAGRIKVEPKKDTRKRLKRSPDDADALLLAFADVDRGRAQELDGAMVELLAGYRGV